MEWFIAIIVMTGSGNSTFRYHNTKPMTFVECEKAAKTFQSKMPSGGDAEVGIAVVCTKGHTEYSK